MDTIKFNVIYDPPFSTEDPRIKRGVIAGGSPVDVGCRLFAVNIFHSAL